VRSEKKEKKRKNQKTKKQKTKNNLLFMVVLNDLTEETRDEKREVG
jgi:hypothetical protein